MTENKEKTKRLRKSPHEFVEAVNEVIEKGFSIRSVALSHNIGKSYLARLVNKAKTLPVGEEFLHKPNIGNRKVFTFEEENMLSEYLKTACKMAYGLTYTQTRQLAYQYAKKLNKEVPLSWEATQKAGLDWLRGFMKRHPDLSHRQPESTSLSRASSFNPTNVKNFYEKLENVLKKYKFTPDRIHNADETGLCTVTNPPKVIAERGSKQVAQASSAERGQLVTMLGFISASGNTVPPVFIFPRVRFKTFMLEDCPTGSIALCNKSGWMNSVNFTSSFQHFVNFTNPSLEKPVLLLIDNHDSHINIDVIKEAKEKGVVILTFPPHCSHKLQPLDVGVYGPFKTYFKVAQNNWLVTNPGKTVSIYHLPKFAKTAYEGAFTLKNIKNSFEKTGIHPFNSNNFAEHEFLTSYVTDRPIPANSALPSSIPNSCEQPCTSTNQSDQLDTSLPVIFEQTSPHKPLQLSVISPENVRPFPKAEPRKMFSKGRKRGYSRVLTDTPEKENIERQLLEKQCTKKNKTEPKKKAIKRKVFEESSDSDVSLKYAESDEDDFLQPEEDNISDQNEPLVFGDHVLVKFATKKTIKFAVGKIVNVLPESEFTVKFMKKKNDVYHFVYPDVDDIADIELKDIEMKLPLPHVTQGTERIKCFYSFSIDFEGIIFC